jgi:hypothetical protein
VTERGSLLDKLHYVLIGFGALLGGQVALLYRISESLHSILRRLNDLPEVMYQRFNPPEPVSRWDMDMPADSWDIHDAHGIRPDGS